MFSLFLRLAVIAVLLVAVIVLLAVALCVGGLGIGSLMNSFVPSIDFGTATLIAVVALGFAGALALNVVLMLPLSLRLLAEERDEMREEDEEELQDDELVVSMDEQGEMLVGRFRESPMRHGSPDQARPSKTKRRRRPKRGRGRQ